MSAAVQPVVFLLDVDNTLLDTDRVARDLRRFLQQALDVERANRYWELFESMRAELGYADYLGALQRFRLEHPTDTQVLVVSSYLVEYPFANRLFPGALDVIEQLNTWGPTVILTDGDVVFQPRKIERAGLRDAVEGRVLIYVHKEAMLADVEAKYPAEHYVLVDDKVRLLAAIKHQWGKRVTTVWPRQGHYALDEKAVALCPAPDITVERIADVLDYPLATLLG